MWISLLQARDRFVWGLVGGLRDRLLPLQDLLMTGFGNIIIIDSQSVKLGY